MAKLFNNYFVRSVLDLSARQDKYCQFITSTMWRGLIIWDVFPGRNLFFPLFQVFQRIHLLWLQIRLLPTRDGLVPADVGIFLACPGNRAVSAPTQLPLQDACIEPASQIGTGWSLRPLPTQAILWSPPALLPVPHPTISPVPALTWNLLPASPPSKPSLQLPLSQQKQPKASYKTDF